MNEVTISKAEYDALRASEQTRYEYERVIEKAARPCGWRASGISFEDEVLMMGIDIVCPALADRLKANNPKEEEKEEAD